MGKCGVEFWRVSGPALPLKTYTLIGYPQFAFLIAVKKKDPLLVSQKED